jgi:hypothetical protein
MQCKTLVLAVVGAASALTAVTAPAHQGHTSCGGGAPAVVEAFGLPVGPGPDFGTLFVSPLARTGQAKATIETLHEAYCADEPGEQPPLRPQANTQQSNQSARAR